MSDDANDLHLSHSWQDWQQRSATEPAQIDADSPLLTPPRATAAQGLAYIQRRSHGEYTDYDLEQVIVPTYWRVCTSVGLDPLLALAQMILETDNLCSWWAARPRRNPAGLGVTGSASPTTPALGVWAWREDAWHEGLSFGSWRDEAIPAHIGRLLAYALTDAQANQSQQTLITQALTIRPLPEHYRGVAPILRGLNGRWAVPGTDYADRIARIAHAIVTM